MNFEVVAVEGYSALVLSLTCAHSELGQRIGELYGQIMASNPEADLLDAPRLYYLDWQQDTCTIEAALPVDPAIAETSSLGKKFEPCKALMGTHMGPYEGLVDSWMALWAEAQKRNMASSGAPWDEYVTDPGEEPDASQWVTNIYIPI